MAETKKAQAEPKGDDQTQQQAGDGGGQDTSGGRPKSGLAQRVPPAGAAAGKARRRGKTGADER